MKKLMVLIGLVLFIFSGFSQNPKNYAPFLNPVFQQNKSHISAFYEKFSVQHIKNNIENRLLQHKNANVLKQRLDSVVAPESDKDLYLYDASGNLLLDTYFEWDGNKWINSWKDNYDYDENGNLIQHLSYEWDGTKWTNLWKEVQTFDPNGNRIVYISSTWDSDLNKWIIDGKHEFIYNNNNIIQQITSLYDKEEEQYYSWQKLEFTYDLTDNIIQLIFGVWDGDKSIWMNSEMQESDFDSFGNRILQKTLNWDGENWIESEKQEAVVNTAGNITEKVSFYWDSEMWTKELKLSYNFDDNNNIIATNAFIFDGDEWFPYFKFESYFDDFGNKIKYIYYELDFESEELILSPVWKDEYTYDNNFTFEDLILPFSESDFDSDFEDESIQTIDMLFKHKLTNISYYESDGSEFYNWGNYTLYYSEQNFTDINDFDLAKTISTYPNPATKQITFTINAPVDQFTIEIYNIHGMLMMSKIGENNVPISIESLESGLYFYRLEGNQNNYSGKFMIK